MDDNSRKKSNVSYRPSGGLIFYGLLLVILVVFSVVMFGNNYGKAEQTTLSDVVRYIESSDYEVTDVEVNGTKVVLNYHEKDSTVEKQLVQEILLRVGKRAQLPLLLVDLREKAHDLRGQHFLVFSFIIQSSHFNPHFIKALRFMNTCNTWHYTAKGINRQFNLVIFRSDDEIEPCLSFLPTWP